MLSDETIEDIIEETWQGTDVSDYVLYVPLVYKQSRKEGVDIGYFNSPYGKFPIKRLPELKDNIYLCPEEFFQ